MEVIEQLKVNYLVLSALCDSKATLKQCLSLLRGCSVASRFELHLSVGHFAVY